MVAANFDRSYVRVRVFEGGNVDDPHDPGGRTSRGVTQRVYNAWCDVGHMARRDVWTAPDAHIKAIYKTQYWDRAGCDRMSDGVDYAVFDAAVNSGPAQAKKWLQRALGEARIDGIIGHVAEAKMATCDPVLLSGGVCDRRRAFMKVLRTFPRYGKGWLRRVAEVETTSKAWAAESESPIEPAYFAGMHIKATMADAPPLPSPALGDVSAGGGAASVAISGLQDKLTPYADSVAWLKPLLAALVIAGFAVAGLGLALGWYVRRRRAQLHDALDLVEVRPGAEAAESVPPQAPDDDAPPAPPVAAPPALAGAAA